VPGLLGLDQEQTPLDGHARVTDLARRIPGVRIPRTGAVLEALVPSILEQKVIGEEARRAIFELTRRHGEMAPGPPELRLRVPPSAATLAALPYFAFHPYGVERRRADVIRRVAGRAAWFEAIVDLPLPDAYARLTAVAGIGPWTAGEVGIRALGDTDAVSVGDYHLPHLVSYALAGEPRGTDARMLELLEPFRPHRARVIRLLELGGPRMPRRGPRLSFRSIEGT
jgi:3-methyladenine DNA glycosylase/8-oxoguanine DNA glycosylase